ncbi:MAG: hypothetical protein DRO11_08485, partial [Methanobacteriota archaeon]
RITDILEHHQTLFRNEYALAFDHIPQEFPHREGQIEALARTIRPALKGEKPFNCLCFGPTSTGKTGSVKYLFRQLSEYSSIKPIYINCFITNSPTAIMNTILSKITNYAVRRKGVALDETYTMLLKIIKRRGVIPIIALDEIDALLTRKDSQETLYHLLRTYETMEKTYIGLIGIINDAFLTKEFDPRVKSVLCQEEIYYPPYSLEEIKTIIQERVKEAFLPGVLEPGVITLTAQYAYEKDRDIRVAFETLRKAGVIAEKDARKTITVEHVKTAYQEAKHVHIKTLLDRLDDEEKEMLRTILKQYSPNKETTSDAVIAEMVEKHHRTPQHYRSLLRRLEWLRLVDLLELDRRGHAKEIILRVPPDVLEQILGPR